MPGSSSVHGATPAEQALANALTAAERHRLAPNRRRSNRYSVLSHRSRKVRTPFTKLSDSIISQDGGSDEAYAAEYYLAGIDVTDGKQDDALKKYDHVASGSNADYASMAKLAKAQVLFSVNRAPEAETVLKDLIANPTAMVSKEQASMVLANGIAASQPEEARKLLTPPIASRKNPGGQHSPRPLTRSWRNFRKTR